MSVVYRCVNKKNMRKRTFFRAGQCAALSSFRGRKNAIFVEKGMFFTILQKVAEVREYAF